MVIIAVYISTMFRLKLVAARDGLLPSFLSGIHNDFYTPLPAILVQVCMHIMSPGLMKPVLSSQNTPIHVMVSISFCVCVCYSNSICFNELLRIFCIHEVSC